MGRLQANSSLVKTNKISIKKQNLGGGKIQLYKFLPNVLQGLALWLKADAGTITEAEQFISQIVLSDAGTPEVDGTYTRASGGETNFSGSNDLSLDFQFSEPAESGGTIFTFRVFFEGNPMYDIKILFDEIEGMSSLDGVAPEPTASTSLTATGNTLITAWADQSGNSNNCSLPNNVEFLSSPFPSLYFDADSESEITLHPDIFNDFSALSLFAVWNITDGGNNGILGSTNFSNFEIITQNGSVVRMCNNNFDSNINTGGLWYAEQFSLSTITADSAGGGSGTARRNGSTTGVDFNDENIEALQGGQTYKIGRYAEDNDAYFATFSLAELIVYSQKLDGSQIDQVEAYLNDKYNIY